MRTLLATLLALALLLAAAGWWAARRGASLPGWYTEARATGRLESDLVAAARQAQQALVGRFGRELLDELTADDGTPDESFLERLKRRGKLVLEGLRQGREVRLEASDLEGLLLATVHEAEGGPELLAATRAVRAEIGAGELELGAVLVPAELPAERLSDGQRRLLRLALGLAGSDGEVYLALRGPPTAVEGRLVLGPPLELRAGELTLGSVLLGALGVEAPELESGLALDVGRVEVRQVRIEEEVLVLVVSPAL